MLTSALLEGHFDRWLLQLNNQDSISQTISALRLSFMMLPGNKETEDPTDLYNTTDLESCKSWRDRRRKTEEER